MKLQWIICVCFLALFSIELPMEAEAVRPPLKPLNREQLQKMIVDADVIATGAIIRVDLSKNLQPPLETVIIQIKMKPDRILKGGRLAKSIAIEESYQQFFKDKAVSDSRQASEQTVTAHIAGPAQPVGRYREGDRILVFLKSMGGSNPFRPLGSGNHDAYLGVFQISEQGVKPDKYRLDETVAGYATSEADFLKFIIEVKGEHP